MPALAARSASFGASSAAAIISHAFRTASTFGSGAPSLSGRQRLQARYPARSAASAVA